MQGGSEYRAEYFQHASEPIETGYLPEQPFFASCAQGSIWRTCSGWDIWNS